MQCMDSLGRRYPEPGVTSRLMTVEAPEVGVDEWPGGLGGGERAGHSEVSRGSEAEINCTGCVGRTHFLFLVLPNSCSEESKISLILSTSTKLGMVPVIESTSPINALFYVIICSCLH